MDFCLSPIRVIPDEPGRGSHLMLPMALAMASALRQRQAREGTVALGELAPWGGACVPQLGAGASLLWLTTSMEDDADGLWYC